MFIVAVLTGTLCRYFGEELTSPASFADIFERGIDPDCDEPQKINHWHSEVPEAGKWPAVEEIRDYERRVRERVTRVYNEIVPHNLTRKLARVLMMVRYRSIGTELVR